MPTTHATPAAARRRLTTLVALNAALAAVAVAGLVASRAVAQIGGGQRPRGAYMMISGSVSGISGSAVYIVDSVNQELIALRYQRSANRLEPFSYRNLAADSAQGGKSR